MPQEYFILLTLLGRSKVAAAIANGTDIGLTHMAVGDVDHTPSEGQTALVHEVYRAAVNQVARDASNPHWVVVELVIPANQGGWHVREVGIFDAEGDLFAVGRYPETYKPMFDEGSGKELLIRAILEISNQAAVNLVIDPNVVTATRDYVDAALAANLAAHKAETAGHQAGKISYDNAVSGLTGTTVQAAVDEVAPMASTTAAGRVRLADLAETAGTRSDLGVTPAGLAGVSEGIFRPASRQTVLSAKTTSGRADFISGVGSAALTIQGAATPLIMAWADGFNAQRGAMDRIASINTDVAVSGLKPGTNFLFAQYNDGSPVFGAAPYPPIYDMSAPSVLTRQGAILAQFEGANGAASYTGVSGETWTFSASNASISTAQYKAGVSSVRIAGTNGYVQCPAPTLGAGPWTMEMFVRMDDATPAADQVLISNDIHYVTQILINTAGKLQVFLGANGSSYNIANGTQSAAAIFADAAWHHFAVVYMGEAYKFYVDGTEVLSIASVLPLYQPGAIRLGIGPSSGSPFIGYFDDFRFSPFARYSVSFTPPASLTPDDVYFFDISGMRMYRGHPGSWTADPVLFLGEAEVGGDGLVDSVVSYALDGFWDSGEYSVAARTIYNKNHNIGTDWLFVSGWAWASNRNKKGLVNNYTYRTDNAHGHGDIVWVSSRLTVHQYIGQWLGLPTLDGSLPDQAATGTVRLFARRAF